MYSLYDIIINKLQARSNSAPMSAWQGPMYLANCCTPVSDIASQRHSALDSSSSRHHLTVPRHRLSTLGRRAFSVAGPIIRWAGTRTVSVNHRSVSTVSDNCWRRTYFDVTTEYTHSAVRDTSWLRYINSWLTLTLTFAIVDRLVFVNTVIEEYLTRELRCRWLVLRCNRQQQGRISGCGWGGFFHQSSGGPEYKDCSWRF